MRDSVVFYKTFYDCIKELSEESGYILYNAVCEYAFYGIEPDLSGLEAGIFGMIKVQIDANNKRYENGKKGAEHGKKGGRPKKVEESDGDAVPEKEETPKGIPCDKAENPKGDTTPEKEETPNVNDYANVNVKKETPNGVKKYFVPPSVEEVRAYCESRKNGVDAQAFVNFYQSKGWMVGKNKMKDWKAAVGTWERNGRRNGGSSNGRTGGNDAEDARDPYARELERMLGG